MFEDKLKEILKESFEADTVMQDAFELNQKKALLSIKQAIVESLPKKDVFKGDEGDTIRQATYSNGVTVGWNICLQAIRKALGLDDRNK